MNNKLLLIVFLVLLGVYGLTKVFSGKKDQSFKTELIAIDTSAVNQIIINTKGPETEEITLKKEGENWIASNGQLNVKAPANVVSSILGNLVLIKTKRVAANKPEKWTEYELDEGQATRVQVFKDEKLMEDFLVGRFSFNQQTRSGISFIRLNGENEVYAVDGFQTLTFGQGFDSYRNKEIVKMTPEMNITEFAYESPDTTLKFFLANDTWTVNGTIPLDSTKVGNYLNVLRNVSGTEFADDFDELQSSNFAHKKLTIKGDNFLEPFVVSCYRDTTREKEYIIRSNQNTEAFFASDSAGVYQRIFKEVADFITE